MSKGLEALKRVKWGIYVTPEERVQLCECIEQELKQAEKDKEMLDIFKNAITIEREIPPELEIKESEKGSSYVFREAIKIHENRIEEMLKKSLRKWVLKNAFPKELKALEIFKTKIIGGLFLKLLNDMLASQRITYSEYDLLKEVL